MRLHSVLAALLATAACRGAAPESTTAVRDSAGVRIAEAPAADVPLDWTLTEAFRLGGADTGAGAFTRVSAWTVGADTLGRLYVLDPDAHRVAVFDREGRALRTMGRQGGGPGELQFPGTLAVDPGGAVFVFDYGKFTLVRFGADGEVLPELRVPNGAFPQGGFLASGGRLTMVNDLPHDEGGRMARSVARILGPGDTVELRHHASPTSGMVTLSCVSLNIPPLFTSKLVVGGRDDLVALADQATYQVDLYRAGRLVASLRRPVPAVPADEGAVERLHPGGMTLRFPGGGTCTVPAAELFRKAGVAASVPLVRAVAVAPDRSVWVQRFTFTDEPPNVDVFSAAGEYLGTLQGRPLPLGFPGPDLVAFPLEDDATGATLVSVVRVRR